MHLKNVLMEWVGRRIGLTDYKFWRSYYGGETWAGETISPETAMQVAAFWACVRLISRTIGTLPLGLYARKKDGERITRSDHILYRLLHDAPNADSTAVNFWEGMVACLCITGNAFAEKSFGTGKLLTALTILRPDMMVVERTERGELRYRYTERGKERVLSEDKVFHIRGFGMGGDVGLSPVAYARQSLSAARATERASATIFANGMRPSGWLVYKGGTLKQQQRDDIKKNIIEPMTGAENAGKIGVLEADFDYKQITIPPEDAQMLETRAFGVEEVCRWLGVPPILIGHSAQGQTMWGSGIEQIIIGWLTLSLRPDLSRIEQEIKRSLITAEERQEGLYSEFNVEGLLRADSASRGEFYWKMTQLGAMTPNQICDKENLPRFEGGDVHLINQTLAPLEMAGLQSDLKTTLQGLLAEDNPKLPLKMIKGSKL